MPRRLGNLQHRSHTAVVACPPGSSSSAPSSAAPIASETKSEDFGKNWPASWNPALGPNSPSAYLLLPEVIQFFEERAQRIPSFKCRDIPEECGICRDFSPLDRLVPMLCCGQLVERQCLFIWNGSGDISSNAFHHNEKPCAFCRGEKDEEHEAARIRLEAIEGVPKLWTNDFAPTLGHATKNVRIKSGAEATNDSIRSEDRIYVTQVLAYRCRVVRPTAPAGPMEELYDDGDDEDADDILEPLPPLTAEDHLHVAIRAWLGHWNGSNALSSRPALPSLESHYDFLTRTTPNRRGRLNRA